MGIHSRHSFLAVLFWAVGVLSACGGGDSSGPSGPNEPEPSAPPSIGQQPDATPSAPATDAPPSAEPTTCPDGQVMKSEGGQRVCQASTVEPADPCEEMLTLIERHNPWIAPTVNETTEFAFGVASQDDSCYPFPKVDMQRPPSDFELHREDEVIWIVAHDSTQGSSPMGFYPKGQTERPDPPSR